MDFNIIIGLLRQHWFEAQVFIALFLAMVLQYMFETKKSLKLAITIFISSMLVALLSINLLMALDGVNLFNFELSVSNESPLIIFAVGLSTLISVHIVSIIITFLPDKLRKSIKTSLDSTVNNRDRYDRYEPHHDPYDEYHEDR